MLSRRARLLLPAFLTTAGLAVAGCGGGGGGGDEESYVKTYEGACKKILTSANGVQGSVSEIAQTAQKDPNGAVTKIRESITGVFDTFGDQVDVLADADAPEKWSKFQDSVKSSSDGAKKAVDEAKAKLAEIKTPQDLSKLSTVLNDIDFDAGGEDLPKELGEKAPSCKTVMGSGGSA